MTRWNLTSINEQRHSRTRSEEHTSELQSQSNLVCRLLLEKKKKQYAQSVPVCFIFSEYCENPVVRAIWRLMKTMMYSTSLLFECDRAATHNFNTTSLWIVS